MTTIVDVPPVSPASAFASSPPVPHAGAQVELAVGAPPSADIGPYKGREILDYCGCGGRCSFCCEFHGLSTAGATVSTSVLTATSSLTSIHPTYSTPFPIVPSPDFTWGSDAVVRLPPHAGVELAEDKTIPTSSPPVPHAGVQRGSGPVVLHDATLTTPLPIVPSSDEVEVENVLHLRPEGNEGRVFWTPRVVARRRGKICSPLCLNPGQCNKGPCFTCSDSSPTSTPSARHTTGGPGKKRGARLFSSLSPRNSDPKNSGSSITGPYTKNSSNSTPSSISTSTSTFAPLPRRTCLAGHKLVPHRFQRSDKHRDRGTWRCDLCSTEGVALGPMIMKCYAECYDGPEEGTLCNWEVCLHCFSGVDGSLPKISRTNSSPQSLLKKFFDEPLCTNEPVWGGDTPGS